MTTIYQYPFTPRHVPLDGHRLCYLDEGEGEVVVMVHGNPSWSYLYRNLVTALRGQYRCIVPDHLGCGFSDKPQSYPYRLQNHVDNLEHLLDYLKIERCVLIVHDWGGAIGMGWATRHVERIVGLVVLNTAAFLSSQIPFRITICRWPLLGSWIVRGMNGFAWPATFMAVHTTMDRRIAAGFLLPYDNWRNRVAIHRFVQDIPMTPTHPSWRTLQQVEESLVDLIDKPMIICWGGRDFCFTRNFFVEWQRRFPRALGHYFEHAGHYVLEDAFVEVATRIRSFLGSCYGKL